MLFAAAEAWHDEAGILRVINGASILGPVLSVPSSPVVLTTELGLAWSGSYGWEAGIRLSLLGVAAILTLGAGVVGPRLESATLVWERDDDRTAALDFGRKALRIARLDQVTQFGILALMVMQPGWEGVGTLATLSIVAGILVLRPAPGTAKAV